jgi:hypothetical protein
MKGLAMEGPIFFWPKTKAKEADLLIDIKNLEKY